MKKFLVIYGGNSDTMKKWETASEEDQQKEMQARGEWMNTNAKHMSDMGNPVGQNTRINNKQEVEEVGNEICGYSIVSAENKETALGIVNDNPHTNAPGAYIELMEIVNMEM